MVCTIIMTTFQFSTYMIKEINFNKPKIGNWLIKIKYTKTVDTYLAVILAVSLAPLSAASAVFFSSTCSSSLRYCLNASAAACSVSS